MIVAFAGQIASGKTKISTELTKELGWKRASFGDYLRHLASERDLDDSREQLQKLGEEVIHSGWTEFCQKVLNHARWEPGENLLIDGVRHIEAIENLKVVCSPQLVYLVFVNTSDEIRYTRFQQRDASASSKLDQHKQHSSEAQSQLLKTNANVVLDGSKSINEIVSLLVNWIDKGFKQ